MKLFLLVVGLLFTSAIAQDVVQVICSQNAIMARIQKEVVKMAEYKMEDVHLNDRDCSFDAEDGEFYVREISPLTSCGTHFEVNDTHVEFTNSISTVQTGPSYPYGVVVGSQANKKVLSALISCTYRIDLNVSTMFIPNISIIVIQMPDAFGAGEFRAAMSIYTDETYQTPYIDPPVLEPEATLFVGVYLVGDASEDVYLLIEECWGTTSEDSSSTPKYPLIKNGCPVRGSADGNIRVTQNGIGHQGLWNSPVFKFVGEGEEFDNVWLHCNLQLCINKECKPTCPAKRKRRSVSKDLFWGPDDFDVAHLISIGPIGLLRITQISKNDTKTTYVGVEEFPHPSRADRLSADKHKGGRRFAGLSNYGWKISVKLQRRAESDLPHFALLESNAAFYQLDLTEKRNSQRITLFGLALPETTTDKMFWTPTALTVVAVLGGLALICVILGLVAIILKSRNRASDGGFDMNGVLNKAYE